MYYEDPNQRRNRQLLQTNISYEDPKKRRKRQIQQAEYQSKADLQRTQQKKNSRYGQALTARNTLGQTGKAFQGTKGGDALYKYTGQEALDMLKNNPKDVISNMINPTKNIFDGANNMASAGSQLLHNTTNAVDAANSTTSSLGATAGGAGNIATGASMAGTTATEGAGAVGTTTTEGASVAADTTSAATSAVPVVAIITKAIEEYVGNYKQAEAEQNNKLLEASNDALTDAITSGNEKKLQAVKGLNEEQTIANMIDNHIKNNSEQRYEQLGIEKPETISLDSVTEDISKVKEEQMKEANKNAAKAEGGFLDTLLKPVDLLKKGVSKLTELSARGKIPYHVSRKIDTGIPAIEALDRPLQGKFNFLEDKNPLVEMKDNKNEMVNTANENLPVGQTQSAKNATENISGNLLQGNVQEDANALSIIKDIMNQVKAGYADNRENGIAFENLSGDPDKTGWNRVGEAFGTATRIAANPYVQGAIAGGLYGVGKGDALYGLGKGWEWAQGKSKADQYYKAITGRDDAPIFNSYDLDDYKAHVKNTNDQREYERKVYNDMVTKAQKDEDQALNAKRLEAMINHYRAMESNAAKKIENDKKRIDLLKNRDTYDNASLLTPKQRADIISGMADIRDENTRAELERILAEDMLLRNKIDASAKYGNNDYFLGEEPMSTVAQMPDFANYLLEDNEKVPIGNIYSRLKY